MTWQTKKLGEMKKAWLAQWNFYAENEDERLLQCGIKNKIADVISVRRTFEQVKDIAKDIYRRERSPFSEKVYLANYSKGKQRLRDFFEFTPLFTHCSTDAYINYMRSFRENGMDSPRTQKLYEQFRKLPIHVSIGHNPSLEIRLVSNLVVKEDEGGREILEWDDPLVDGTYKRERYEK